MPVGALAGFPTTESARRSSAFLRLTLRTVPIWRWPGALWLYYTGARAAPQPAGSGFYAPTLFDRYSAFTLRPAAMFALPVVRAVRTRSPVPGAMDETAADRAWFEHAVLDLEGALLAFPVLYALWGSLFDTDTIGGPQRFVGLEQYVDLFKNPDFIASIVRTVVFVGGTIVVGGTFPLTGVAAAYAPIPLGMKAYFSPSWNLTAGAGAA